MGFGKVSPHDELQYIFLADWCLKPAHANHNFIIHRETLSFIPCLVFRLPFNYWLLRFIGRFAKNSDSLCADNNLLMGKVVKLKFLCKQDQILKVAGVAL